MSFKIDHIGLAGSTLSITIDAGDPGDRKELQVALANLALATPDEIVQSLLGLRPVMIAEGAAKVSAPAKAVETVSYDHSPPAKPLSNVQPYVDAPAAVPAEAKPAPKKKLAAVPTPAAPTPVKAAEPEADPMEGDAAPSDEQNAGIPEAILKATKMREVVTALHETYGYTDAEQFAAWAKENAKLVPFFATMPNAVDRARAAGKMLLSGG